MSDLRTTDVLVIGGGLAGERCAMEAAAAGHEVTIISLVPPRRSHSCAAQGGMQAALGNCVKAAGDSPDMHFLDTVRGSDWGADQEVVRIFADNAPSAADWQSGATANHADSAAMVFESFDITAHKHEL